MYRNWNMGPLSILCGPSIANCFFNTGWAFDCKTYLQHRLDFQSQNVYSTKGGPSTAKRFFNTGWNFYCKTFLQRSVDLRLQNVSSTQCGSSIVNVS